MGTVGFRHHGIPDKGRRGHAAAAKPELLLVPEAQFQADTGLVNRAVSGLDRVVFRAKIVPRRQPSFRIPEFPRRMSPHVVGVQDALAHQHARTDRVRSGVNRRYS